MSPILVSDIVNIDIESGFTISGDAWRAYVTAIPAKVLYTLYNKHKTKLFSANVRDYLGGDRLRLLLCAAFGENERLGGD